MPASAPIASTGNRFICAVSQRALIHTLGFQPPGHAAFSALAPGVANSPGIASQVPHHEPSPGLTAVVAVGRRRRPLAGMPTMT